MSVHLDIERLRFDLSSSGIDSQDVYTICDAAASDINEFLVEIISDSVSQALDYALNIGADEFVDDIQVIPDSNGIFQISTHSGTLDYSKDKQEMLRHLLKNADISEDGNRYKVIPIEKKTNQVEHSMFSMLQSRQDALDDARLAIRKQAMSKRIGITEAIRTNLSQQISAAKTSRQLSQVRSGDVEFRTASDKQDPETSWVIPAKDADMTSFISDVNRQLITDANNGISNIIGAYYSTYIGV